MKRIISLFLLVIVAGLIPLAPLAAQSGDAPQVRAVLFWRETCGHCHYVITEVFPPLQAQYGDQLEIVMIELGSEPAARRFYAAGEAMGLAPETMGVPLMIIGDHLLIGSQQIPQELPGLIDSYLAAGGVDIPAIAGLEDLALPAAMSCSTRVLAPWWPTQRTTRCPSVTAHGQQAIPPSPRPSSPMLARISAKRSGCCCGASPNHASANVARSVAVVTSPPAAAPGLPHLLRHTNEPSMPNGRSTYWSASASKLSP